MSLRNRLREILPDILPRRAQDAIKGRELIARVREVLGDTYSDGSLRTQFSILLMEENTCLARIANGHGYYLRRDDDPLPTLHDVFAGQEASEDSPLHSAIALAVRLYDTAGLSVFVYPVEEEESWTHPDLVAVQWPAGAWGDDGAYTMEAEPERGARFRAVCVGVADSPASCRAAFYRALACGQWAHESELLLLGEPGAAAPELERLATRYGVGVRSLGDGELELPGAEAIFRADMQQARALLSEVPCAVLATPRHCETPSGSPDDEPDVQPMLEWARQCVACGRVEAYERRVAVN